MDFKQIAVIAIVSLIVTVIVFKVPATKQMIVGAGGQAV
jgi:hypothetical protein